MGKMKEGRKGFTTYSDDVNKIDHMDDNWLGEAEKRERRVARLWWRQERRDLTTESGFMANHKRLRHRSIYQDVRISRPKWNGDDDQIVESKRSCRNAEVHSVCYC